MALAEKSAASMAPNPVVRPFYDENSNTFTYVVCDPHSKACAIIDSVANFEQASGAITYECADQLIEYIKRESLDLQWILETHVHADHLSAAPYLQRHLGGKLGIGAQITVVQETFGKIFNEDSSFKSDGSQFDHLLNDGDTVSVGGLVLEAMHTPGHTPACMTYIIGDAVFVGDTLFMPDGGTARADFPGGDAKELYQSIRKILSLPRESRVFVCHDYRPNGRNVEYQTTIEKEKNENVHVHTGVSEDTFTRMRESRDLTLGMPQLILPSIQINMRAGQLPLPEDTGQVFLKIPINAFK